MRLALALIVLATLSANAAELPSRSTKSGAAEPKLPKCEIEGVQGVQLANGTCVRLSGYVNAGVSSGTLKH